MKALIPNTKDFLKEAIVKFLNIISDEKIEAVLKGGKAAKAANTPVIAPVIVVAGGLPLPTRIGYNGLGMDGLVRKRNSLKPIVNLFPKKMLRLQWQ
ncbi:hypothetical protein [Rickettsia sp. Tenjiku01]|uniref:hypothetical protein n=1 Tax=Rickettsia sp. Tenjiku01 TaxID=1736693 RepID=UPI0007DB00A8|nr:hypothetical protein [Rickettsia sp. Tenjiku01]